MTRRATARAAANIAFVKYWGARDLERTVPANPSISMTLSECATRTTVVFHEGEVGEDTVTLVDARAKPIVAPESFALRSKKFFDVVRERFKVEGRFGMMTHNTFPAGSGMASSASGFAALAAACAAALDQDLSDSELSSLARSSGSGSAARSTMGGFVEWPRGFDEENNFAFDLAPASHWDLCDVIAVVDSTEKKVSSLEGHMRAPTSPHFSARLKEVVRRLAEVRRAIETKDIERLGETMEEEAIELHLIAMSSKPPIFYWQPATLRVLEELRRLRADGITVYGTMDAGANVHAICESSCMMQVQARLTEIPGVERVISDRIGAGAQIEAEHLV